MTPTGVVRQTRVVLATEIISPYRIAPFNHLAALPGVDLHVLFLAETEPRRAWSVPQESMRFRFEVLGGWTVSKARRFGALFINPGIVRKLHSMRPDVLILGGWHQPTYWFAAATARRLGIPYVLWSESTLADHRPGGRVAAAWKRWIVGGAACGLVPGGPQAEYLEALGMRRERIHVAPNAVDNAFFADNAERARADRDATRRALGLRGTVFLYVGRLTDSKGIPDLLEAHARAGEDASCTVLLVGNGPDEIRYRAWCRERGLTSVVFAGFHQQSDLPRFYAVADAFVFPTHSDPWGLVLNEAMACGLPLISTTVAGAAPELVVPGENGFVYEPGDVDRLASLMLRLHEDGALRERMGRRSREIVKAFSPEAMALGFARAARAAVDIASDARLGSV